MMTPRGLGFLAASAALLLSFGCSSEGTSPPAQVSPDADVSVARSGGVVVEDAYVTEPPPGSTVLGGYMRIVNGGGAERFLKAEGDLFESCELHETVPVGDTLKMVERPDGIPLEPGGVLELRPGGAHLMLFGLQQEVRAGDSIPLRLHFQAAGVVDVQLQVRER